MPKFLKANGISLYIETIIDEAKELLVLITPFLKLTPELIVKLKEADRRNVLIIFIYGKKELSSQQEAILAQLRNLNLYYLTELHAKCYLNEQHILICSMNLYDYSIRNNWEMGILLERDNSKAVCDELLQEIEIMIGAAIPKKISRKEFEIYPKSHLYEYAEYFNEILKTNKFRVIKGKDEFDEECFDISLIANNYPIEGINIMLNRRVEFILNFTQEKLTLIKKEFKYEDLLDKYRIYINSPDVISLYQSIEMRDNWNKITVAEKKEYLAEAIQIICQRITAILKKYTLIPDK